MNPSDTSAAATTPDEREEAGFPIVGVGASAGGVEAMRNFVVALPPTPGVSLILVLHLPGDYSSHLPEIMAQNCALPVRTIHDGDLVERDVIHVLPPGQSVTLANGRLQLRPRPDLSEWHPVDRLFHSLASQAHERTVAVILSGTGTNGSSALGAIKNTSGLVIVQDPAEALFKDMPRNAIATGLVDHTATCAGIAAILADWGRRLPVAEQPLTTDADQVDGILELVRNHTGRDFSNYKRGTMQRRIYRRSSLLRQESLASYRELCRHQPAEIELLSRDLLIGVTSFFRDRPTWELLERELLPPLLDHRRADEPFRAWVAGCSTGEEAYSLAIAIHEVQARHGNHRPVQIFATDLDRSACDAARQGVFPAAAMTGLKDEQVAQHFIKDAHGFRLVQRIRDMITFAQHNLLRDPPFSHLDLISCRNVLIYLDKEAQHEVLGLFHFALRRDGLLLLGSSETAHRQDDLFTTVDDSHRCYRRSEIPSPPLLMTRRGIGFRSMGPFSPVPALRRSGAGAAHAPSPVIAEASPSGSAPAFVMVDDDYRPCYHYGSIATFLPHAEPFANESVLEHCDPTLSGMLNAALQKCAAESAPTSIHYVTHPRVSAVDARSATLLPVIEVTVQPIHGEGRASLFMISFRERLGPQEEPLRDAVDRGEVEALHALGMLQEELKSTREELSSSIEELETSNEELKASNEEVRSMYEELQSANEELETSREELMSVNEELGAVNKRLHENVEELADTSDVLSNLLSSTDLPTLFLDRQLCIQRFTPAAGRLMRLIPGDVGRPLEDLNDHLGGDRLLGDARRVLTFLIPIEGEVQTADGSAFMLRTHPYRTADDRIEGVVITLTNIDLLKRAEDELRDSEQRLRTIFDNAAVGMAQIGAGGGILTCNQTLCQITGLARHVLTSKPLSEFIEPRHWPPLAQALERLMRTANASETLELPLQREDGRRWLRCTLSSVGGSERREVILIVEDITGRREAEHQLQHRTHQLQRSNEDLSHFAAMASHDLQAPLRIIGGYLDMITQLGDDLSEDQKRKYFARVIDNVHVMRRMITDMLEYARCEMGEVAMESCPLGDAVDSACANLAPLIAEQEAEIIVGNLPTVTAPTRLVVQLFQNLIDNAIKYRRQVRPKITITADRDGDAWRVQVADNGRGIAKQDAPHVFSLFERGDRVQQGGGQHPKISGSGLGLAICRKAIDRLGGRIWFDSQPDQGTTFSFLLPDPTTRMKTVPSASDA